MVFSVGETVVYPHHGAALIEAIETRVIKGEEKLYLVLRVAQGDLTVRVPAENAEIVGVREVVELVAEDEAVGGERPLRLRAGYDARSGFRTAVLDPAVLLSRARHALRAAEQDGSDAGAIRPFVSRPTPQ